MSLYMLSGILSAIISGSLALVVLARRPPGRLGPCIFFVLVAVALWSIGETLTEHVEADSRTHWIYVQILYTGVLMLTPAW